MWGQICSELTNLYNFNVSFSTHKSEVLIHLSQWQYWWWFWFSFFWTFYFFMILRSIKHRVSKMNVRVNTSFRSRGKWGDYLVTLIPLSWCLNILLNSNFILRMIEWQSESGALIVRIHGKQWYWVYKYDLSNVMSILNTPKNIGHDRWFSGFKDGKSVNDKYLQTAQTKIRQSTQQEYWGEVSAKDFNPVSNFKTTTTLSTSNNVVREGNLLELTRLDNNELYTGSLYTGALEQLPNSDTYLTFSNTNNKSNLTKGLTYVEWALLSKQVDYRKVGGGFSAVNNSLYFYENAAADDDWEVYSNLRVSEYNNPIRFLQTNLNNYFYDNTANKSFILVKFKDLNSLVVEKPEENLDFIVVKQKRYKRKQSIGAYWVNSLDANSVGSIVKKKPNQNSTSRFLQNNLIIRQITSTGASNSFDFYSSMKLNRVRSEMFSVNLARRLLRTTRTLVLPAYTNISLIANSYDVVHSWFIPGLGLKIDCVPGKSTHHSLYIDNIGLYYGQCAEICGRYHHHMPIRVCALPFEHFIVWWTSKGLPKSLRMRYDSKAVDETILTKYRW